MRTLCFISLKMKLKLKTILISAKTELSSKGKYRLKYKNSVPGASDGGNGSEKLLTNFICLKVPPRRCLSNSGESSTASIFETGDRGSPTDNLVIGNNKLENLPKKREVNLDMLDLLKKKESGSETFLFWTRLGTVKSCFR